MNRFDARPAARHTQLPRTGGDAPEIAKRRAVSRNDRTVEPPPTRPAPAARTAGDAQDAPAEAGIENLDHLVEDNRDICFEQGKPCVYQDEDQPDHIITEWPNGVVDTKDLATGNVIRVWPDGRSEALTGQATVPRLPAASE